MSESKQDIDINENMKKYSQIVDILENKIRTIVELLIDGFDGADVLTLGSSIAVEFARVKKIIENIKEVNGDDRLTIYNIIIANVIKKVILVSVKLTDDQKMTIEGYFGENGLITNLLIKIRDVYEQKLEEMDTNDDNQVTKKEFEDYYEQNCSCCGNKGCTDCIVAACGSCCFPILSGGKNSIKIDS